MELVSRTGEIGGCGGSVGQRRGQGQPAGGNAGGCLAAEGQTVRLGLG